LKGTNRLLIYFSIKFYGFYVLNDSILGLILADRIGTLPDRAIFQIRIKFGIQIHLQSDSRDMRTFLILG